VVFYLSHAAMIFFATLILSLLGFLIDARKGSDEELW
jgi:hypothetical protein